MAGLEQQAAKDLKTSKENAVSGKDSARGARGDIDEMDDEESYYKSVLIIFDNIWSSQIIFYVFKSTLYQ